MAGGFRQEESQGKASNPIVLLNITGSSLDRRAQLVSCIFACHAPSCTWTLAGLYTVSLNLADVYRAEWGASKADLEL